MLAGRPPFGFLRWFHFVCFFHLVSAVCLPGLGSHFSFATSICSLVFLSSPQAFVICSFFLYHRHLWFGLSFFVTGICGLFFLSLPQAFVFGLSFFVTGICGLFFLSLPQAFVVWFLFLCHRHLWSVLSFFPTGICGLVFHSSSPQAFVVWSFFLCHRHLCAVSFFHGLFCCRHSCYFLSLPC